MAGFLCIDVLPYAFIQGVKLIGLQPPTLEDFNYSRLNTARQKWPRKWFKYAWL